MLVDVKLNAYKNLLLFITDMTEHLSGNDV